MVTRNKAYYSTKIADTELQLLLSRDEGETFFYMAKLSYYHEKLDEFVQPGQPVAKGSEITGEFCSA